MIIIPKKGKKGRKPSKKVQIFKSFDELLLSDMVSKKKILELVDLANISRQETETKKSLCIKILYESTYGLDELLDLCFDQEELEKICHALELDARNKKKANLIGMLVETLPTKKKRKIYTVIEEDLEEEFDRGKIFNLFIAYYDGRCLFSYNPEPLGVGDSHMISSALNAIGHLVRHITKSEQKLRNIDMGDKELIFEYGTMDLTPTKSGTAPQSRLIGVLLVNRETSQMKNFLKKFIKEFEIKYKKCLIPKWDGNMDVFLSAYELVDETLKSAVI
ncbi:MAG: hypothetical protein ACFFDN_16885 [Candidatus Hodarchaeota archaeon]